MGSVRGMKKEIAKEQSKDERPEDLLGTISLCELSTNWKLVKQTKNSNMTIKHQPEPKHQSNHLQWEIKNMRESQNRVIYINNQI